VINLRGSIIGIVDLRQKFDIKPQLPGLILTVEVDGETIGAVVDDVVTVVEIEDTRIQRNVRVETKIPLEFFKGVATVEDRLVNIVDVGGTINAEDLATIRRAQDTKLKGAA
jgi:purine-binding chemotaxis protein CheW